MYHRGACDATATRHFIKADVRQAETFAEVARLYIEKHAKREKASWQEDQRKIERDLLPRWGKRKMKDIRRREIISGAGEWVLASRNQRKRLANLRSSNQRLLDLTGIEPRFTPHDLRRTASTLMQRFGVDPAVIDRIQDHLDSASVRATYQRHGYGVERRRALVLLATTLQKSRCSSSKPTRDGRHI